MIRRLALAFLILANTASAQPLNLRVIAANLTSDKQQSYSPDNGNHSNPEGAGARILKALKPDVVLIQEFNTTMPARQWVNATFGKDYHFFREETKGIPNGIISRYPIAASGKWDDPVLNNREFAWARIRLPGEHDLWAISVHFHSKNATSRAKQTTALLEAIQKHVPANALVLLGGDFNTRTTGEPCFPLMAKSFVVPDKPPHDGMGNIFTNAPRNRPYDWVLASPTLDKLEVPVALAGLEFDGGLVFDSRVFEPLEKVPPVQETDSALQMMQHMAVVRDFRLP
ncbi:MAG: endonuclease/exonuclease/phosphatase family protein [Verrucomicrobiaceae bacterium]|nr:MAG: endonuclease/exonuclease/phosphatase family protein [Verrucomicrobiaceae bacterium]